MTMNYDIVLVTADRPDMLRVSLPTYLNQTRLPHQIIIVDASKDHARTVEVARQVTKGAAFPIHVLEGPRGMTRQRNFGIARATSPVIFFPDDDSLYYPDVAEHVMRIYERDTEGVIGGVAQKEADQPPGKLSEQAREARQASIFNRARYKLAKSRFRLLQKITVSPLRACGEALRKQHTPPDWLHELNARPVNSQIGFRMSFRAEAVRRYPFNEDLHQPRCGLEDFDASFGVGKHQLLVQAEKALVHHYKFGGRRGDGYEIGLNWLNMCYIVCRHSPPGSQARRRLMSYTRFFLAEAILFRSYSAYERQRLKGLWRARANFNYLLHSPSEELTQRYKDTFNRELRALQQ